MQSCMITAKQSIIIILLKNTIIFLLFFAFDQMYCTFTLSQIKKNVKSHGLLTVAANGVIDDMKDNWLLFEQNLALSYK